MMSKGNQNISATTSITIRPRTANDLAAAASILADVYRTDRYPVEGIPESESWLSPGSMLISWVALLDDVMVGHVLAVSPVPDDDPTKTWLSLNNSIEDIVVLSRLFVHKDARGQGIGIRLTQEATRWAAQRSKRVLLDIMTKDLCAIRLYEKLGWLRVGDVKHDNGRGAVFDALVYISP